MDANRMNSDLAVFSPATTPIPAAIADCGDRASERFFTFFTDTIPNPNTRAAYYRNAMRFFAWTHAKGLSLNAIKSYHVSAYLEELGTDHAAPSVKQHLATLRMLFDWLILGHVLEINPAAAVLFTVTLTGVEVVRLPAASRARAESVCVVLVAVRESPAIE